MTFFLLNIHSRRACLLKTLAFNLQLTKYTQGNKRSHNLSSGFKHQIIAVSRYYHKIISSTIGPTAPSLPLSPGLRKSPLGFFSSSFFHNSRKICHRESSQQHNLIFLDNTVCVFTKLGFNNKSNLSDVCMDLLNILKLLAVRYLIRFV